MSVDRRLLNWGIFLVLLGGVPLAVSQGWIPQETVEQAWELWPLILIGAGIGLILRWTPLAALGGIIVSATFGVILGGLLAVGIGGFTLGSFGCGPADANAPILADEQGTFDGGSGRMELAASCAALDVATTPGADWAVTVRGTENARPTVQRSGGGIEVRSPDRPVVVPFGTQRASWDATVGTDVTLDLGLDVNAGEANVDLSGATVGQLRFAGNAVGSTKLDLATARVDRLDVTLNAGDITVVLPEQGAVRGEIAGNAASITLCASPDAGVRLSVDENITASNNYDEAGLVRSGNTWETPGYDSAATQIDLATTGSAVSYTLDTKGTCR